MLRHGLGRAVIFLRSEADTARLRDTVRSACLQEWRHDTQVEEDRAPYLLDVIEATGEPGYYAGCVRDALETIATPRETEGTSRPQLLALAALLTKSGHGDLRGAIYRAIGRTAGEPDGVTGPGHVVIGLDGIAGYRFLVEQLIRFPRADDDDRWEETRLLDDLEEHLGETAATEALDDLALSAPHLAPYLTGIRRERAEDRESIAAERDLRKVALLTVPTDAEIRAYIDGGPVPKPRLHLTDLATRERLAEELRTETNPERQLRYVRLFWAPANQPFPGDPQILLRFVRQTDDERLAWLSVKPLEHTTHPAIRAAALELLQRKDRVGHGVRLLPSNPGAGDADLLSDLVARDTDPDTFHSIGMGVLDYVERHTDHVLIPVMLACYEKMACTFCRGQIVRELLKRDALPPALYAECRYDADPETRELTAKTPSSPR